MLQYIYCDNSILSRCLNARVLGAREVRASRAPRVSLAPKTPFPFPFKRLPRRLGVDEHRTSSTLSQSDHTYAEAV